MIDSQDVDIAKIRKIQFRARKLVTEMFMGGYRSAFKGQGLEFEEVREYLPGDDVRAIDWNVTARAGKPFIKTFRDERELSLVFAVDLSASTYFGSQKTKNEVIAEVAALLSFAALFNQDKVGLLIFTDEVELYLPPAKSTSHVWRIIRQILNFQPQGKRTDLGTAADYLNKVLRRRSIVFWISDFLDVGLNDELNGKLRRHDSTAIHVYDPVENQFPDLGEVIIGDPERGTFANLPSSSYHFQEQHKATVYHLTKDRDLFFRKSAIPQISIQSSEDSVDQLVTYFYSRQSRGSRS